MHWPALVAVQLLLFGEHAEHGRLFTIILYVPAAQAVQFTPKFVEPNPTLQLPAEAMPQPLAVDEQFVHAMLPAVILYLPEAQAVHVTPGMIELDV
jgi:hypothetical protein